MDTQGKISTGSFDFNDFLLGGYESGIVTMIVGPAGSGKTNFSLLCACSCARNKKVIFVDTEGGFSVERVKQIVGLENLEKILSNIFLLNPTNFQEQIESFEKLKEHLGNNDVGLIVVDSISMLYRLELGELINLKEEERVSEVNRDIAKQMRNLVEIARKKEIPILITNQVYSSFLSLDEIREGKEKETSIVGGDLFKYWSKCIIELKNNGRRKAVLLKHRHLPEKVFSFEIRNEGIFEKKGLF